MNSSRDRNFRVLFAAVVGSGLTPRELRRLVEDLSSGSELVGDLQKAIWEFADYLDSSSFGQPRLRFSGVSAPAEQPIASILNNVVQNSRIPKQRLANLLCSASKRAAKVIDPTKQTAKQMVDEFVARATTDEVRRLMESLGLSVDQDPFLGGIYERTKDGL